MKSHYKIFLFLKGRQIGVLEAAPQGYIIGNSANKGKMALDVINGYRSKYGKENITIDFIKTR